MITCISDRTTMKSTSSENNDTLVYQLSSHQKQSSTDNQLDKNEIWAPDVENAFYKALETIPLLGRKKVSLNGKPCGRNELISDFIYRKTSKIRTRKQISSHIQVLKNNHKNNPIFLRLLTGPKPGYQDCIVQNVTKPHIQVSFPDKFTHEKSHCTHHNRSPFNYRTAQNFDMNPTLHPTYICFYLEQPLQNDSKVLISYTMALLPEFSPISIHNVKTVLRKEFRELLYSATTKLRAKVKLNLNLNLTDFKFNNTFIFETKQRCVIECTTYIYSFGKLVLKSIEMQQALYIEKERFVYNFQFVNPFFEAFIKGLQELSSWREIDQALHQISIIQVFKDVQREEKILAIMYEFRQGEGTIKLKNIIE